MYKKIKGKFPVTNKNKARFIVHSDHFPINIKEAMKDNLTLSSNITMVFERLPTYIPINDKERYDEIIDEIFVDLDPF